MNGAATDYWPYVVAAYAIFAVAMLWDWLAPRLQLRKGLHAARLQARRNAGRVRGSNAAHPLPAPAPPADAGDAR